jgi:hypothetical protein
MISPSDINFDLDERGWRRASAPEGYTALEEFFVADLQSSTSWIRDFITKASEIVSGDRKWFERDGNTCIVEVKPEATTIDHQYFETACTVPTEVLIEMTRRWQTFVAETEDQRNTKANKPALDNP